MSNQTSLERWVEVAMNLAITAAALGLVFVLGTNHLRSNAAQEREIIQVGAAMSLSDVQWAQNGRTLVLAISKDCPFCTESGAFYQRLEKSASARSLPIVIVTRDSPSESREYVRSLGLSFDDIRQADLAALKIPGTPAVLLVNEEGVVTNFWRGKLNEIGERDVLGTIGEDS